MLDPRQLGHVDTTMLFKTYSRFIPNLTRTDGSAFNALVSGVIDAPPSPRANASGRRWDAMPGTEANP